MSDFKSEILDTEPIETTLEHFNKLCSDSFSIMEKFEVNTIKLQFKVKDAEVAYQEALYKESLNELKYEKLRWQLAQDEVMRIQEETLKAINEKADGLSNDTLRRVINEVKLYFDGSSQNHSNSKTVSKAPLNLASPHITPFLLSDASIDKINGGAASALFSAQDIKSPIHNFSEIEEIKEPQIDSIDGKNKT